jgi:hypothetical protein
MLLNGYLSCGIELGTGLVLAEEERKWEADQSFAIVLIGYHSKALKRFAAP